jgi:hypothetical protein
VAGELTATHPDGTVYRSTFDTTACASSADILYSYQFSTGGDGGGDGDGGTTPSDPTVTTLATGRVRPAPMLVSGGRVVWGDGVGSSGPATLNVVAATGGTVGTAALSSEAGGLATYDDRIWTLDDDKLVSVSLSGGDLRTERTFAALDLGTKLVAVVDGKALLQSGLGWGLRAYDLSNASDEGTDVVGTAGADLFTSPDGFNWVWVESRIGEPITLNALGAGEQESVFLAELARPPRPARSDRVRTHLLARCRGSVDAPSR